MRKLLTIKRKARKLDAVVNHVVSVVVVVPHWDSLVAEAVASVD